MNISVGKGICTLGLLAIAMSAFAAPAPVAATQKPHATQTADALRALPRFRFENFTTANGLPDNHVFSVLVDGERSTRIVRGRSTTPATAWRIALCCLWRWTSAPATYGPGPWRG